MNTILRFVCLLAMLAIIGCKEEGTALFYTLRTIIVDNEVLSEETNRFIEGEFAIRLLAIDE